MGIPGDSMVLTKRSDLVNFLKLNFGIILVTLSVGCENQKSLKDFIYEYNQNITGGQEVDPDSAFGRKIIYLALGVEKQITNNGFLLNMTDRCTAVAIKSNILLTAGHCVSRFDTSQIYAVLGGDPWVNDYKEKNWFATEKTVIHPNYVNKEKEAISINDLALIKLNRPLPEDYVVPLTNQLILETHHDKLKLLEVGYGFHFLEVGKNTDDVEQTLNYVVKEINKTDLTLPKFEVDQKSGVGFCSGDSGGPAIILDQLDHKFSVLGIASYIKSHSDDREITEKNMELPCRGMGVYTNLLLYTDWINETISSL